MQSIDTSPHLYAKRGCTIETRAPGVVGANRVRRVQGNVTEPTRDGNRTIRYIQVFLGFDFLVVFILGNVLSAWQI